MSRYFAIFFLWLMIPDTASILAQSCNIGNKKHYNFDDVKYILNKNNCNQCHFKGSLQTDWHYDNYNNLFQTSHCGTALIVRGKPEVSLFIDKINGGPTSCGNAMPLGNKPLNGADLLALESWVEIGAPEFCIQEFHQIQDILISNKCGTCHSASDVWNFNSYADIFKKQANSICSDEVIIKYNAFESLLYHKVTPNGTKCGEIMLNAGKPLNDIELASIRDWINTGAPESAKILPVSLVDFRTQNLSNESILILWKTDAEINTSHFEIEHSIDGIHFNYLDKVKSLSNNGIGQNYSYVFADPVVGYNYFRIKIADFDKSFTFSPVRVERINNPDEIFKIKPNPCTTNSDLTIEWYATDGREKVKLNLLDITGKLCREIIINNGINNINLTGIRNGMYYVSIEDYLSKKVLRKLIILDQ